MNRTRKWRPGAGERATLAILVVAVAALLVQQDWLWRWDRVFYDAQLRLWQRPPPEDIVIIAIDEATLREFGRWPWSRQVHAHLLRLISEEKPRAVAFDIIFAEPNLKDRDGDSRFAAAVGASGRVVLPVLMEQARSGGQPVETLPLPGLANAARALGHVHVELDPDGIARRVYLYEGLGSPHWPHLSVAMMNLAGETPPLLAAAPETTADTAAEAPPETAPESTPEATPETGSPMLWYRDRALLIPFAGPPGHFPHISYGQVMRKDYARGTFRDKYVLIGTTAVGLGDALPTPVSGFSHSMSGVEINANVLDALRRGLDIAPLETHWRILLSGFLALLPILLFPGRGPRSNLLITALMLLATLGVSLGFLVLLHLWFPPTAALLAITLSYPLWSWRRLELAMRYLSQELDQLNEQQSQFENARTVPAAETLDFVCRVLPVSGWTLRNDRGTVLAKDGVDLPEAPRGIPEHSWVHTADCLWTRLGRRGKGALAGIRWNAPRPPDAGETALLNRLFDAPHGAGPASRQRKEKDLQARIAQVQQATQKLRELRQFIDDSLANMADAVLVVDELGQVRLANARASWYLRGDDNAVLAGTPLTPLLEDIVLDQGEDWNALIRQALLDRARMQAGARHRDGRDLLVQIAPLDSGAGHAAGLIFNFSDISLLKASERKRNELLNFLSHDLRSPLVSTSALIELARNRRPDSETGALLDRMERYTASTLALAEQFLQLARAESIDSFGFHELDMVNTALDALEQVWGQAQARNIRLEQRFATDEAWLKGDGDLLQRALVNLLDNAIKHSEDNTCVVLSLERDDGILRCCVEDQGEGIPAAELPHLFERFRRVERQDRPVTRGAGLGLAFVDVVARRHGGSVQVSSEPGKGSRFCLSLPVES